MRLSGLNFGWALAAVILLAFVTAAAVKAQQDVIQLAVSPQVLEADINPGDSITNDFRLTNGSDGPVTINAIPKNFLPQGEEGAIDLKEDDTTFSLAKWITVTPQKVEIPANSTQDFKVEISSPNNAEPGSRFGSVVFATEPGQAQGSGAAVSQEIAPVILVAVAGDLVESAEIADFYSLKSVWSNEDRATLQARVKNSGNVHFRPTGTVVIKNMFGDEVTKIDLEEQLVLPDSIRKLNANWQDFGFVVGKYTAELTVVYGQDDGIATATTSFYIFPYQIILPILAVLALLAALIIRYRKRIGLALKVLVGKADKPDKPSDS